MSERTTRFLDTAKLLVRYGVWHFLNDLILHAFYFSGMQHHIDILEK